MTALSPSPTPLPADLPASLLSLTEKSNAGSFGRLGDRLVSSGLITEDELQTALTDSQSKGRRLGETFVQLGLVEEKDLLPFVAQQLRVPFVQLRQGLIDPRAIKAIPRNKAESLCALGLFCVRGVLTVAMAEPQNLLHLDEL